MSNEYFDDTYTPGFTDPIDSRPSIDFLKNAHAQLREAMKEAYEPNKLKTQTEFEAICLMQLNNTKTLDMPFVRIKARVPELHTLLPIPISETDYRAISLYPTFTCRSNDFDIKVVNGSVLPGTRMRVSYENMGSFAGPKILGISVIQELDPTAQSSFGQYLAERRQEDASFTGESAPTANTSRLGIVRYASGSPSTAAIQVKLDKALKEIVGYTRMANGQPATLMTDGRTKNMSLGDNKYKYPDRKRGWGGKCLQFAAKLSQLAGAPLIKSGSSFATKPEISGVATLGLNTNLSNYLPYIKTPDGKRFGWGCTLQQLAALGILPGMLVHLCVDWDNGAADETKSHATKDISPWTATDLGLSSEKSSTWRINKNGYNIKDAFHHWVVYYGGGKYIDSRGRRSARASDQFLVGWMRGKYHRNDPPYWYGRLHKYMGQKLGKAAPINAYAELIAADPTRKQPRVIGVHAPWHTDVVAIASWSSIKPA
jgi:hypothetical protein